ncbi:MAG TPA: phosphoglucosamine mutase, partial [Acidilobales archaeon]|nr:phosphoglucosamine mutase [Acidilobales archaeon]
MRKLFGTAGIRGEYGKVVTPEIAYKVGLALATFLGGEGLTTVGHDVRLTSPLLATIVSSGLMAGGVDVVNLGLVPTPILAYSVPALNANAGVIITASHNPPPDNGIK